MKNIIIYTDGSCHTKTKTGGWAAVLFYDEIEEEISGSEENTTNNRMELTAVIKALKKLKEPHNVYLHSDSSLITDAFNKNKITKWESMNWKTNADKDRTNKDLWMILLPLTKIHNIEWIKVKAHKGNTYNIKANKLARKAMKIKNKKEK
ncbi:MAG: ribonuclease H family protein [Spirochaetota bacterium]